MNKKWLQSKRGGFAMALMVVTLTLLFATGVGMLSLGLHRRSFGAQTCSGIAARNAADAGLTKALWEMNEKLKIKPWDDSSQPQATDESLPCCDAVFSYSVMGDKDTDYSIVSVGKYGQETKKVSCKLALETPFDTAIFGKQSISLKAGTTIDSYNCENPDGCLKIGTNSTQASAVIARSGVIIDGDVFIGPEGDLDTVIDSRHDATITGETYTLDEPLELPPITVPPYLESLFSIGTITDSITLTGPTKCENVELHNGKVLTIDGPVNLYCTGDFTLDSLSCLLIVDANTNPEAYLNLYLDGNLMVKNSASINNTTKDARKLKIYGLDNCTSIQFLIDTIFYGAIYAPYASVTLQNSVEVYGAIIADTFTQQVSADFHYDASLAEGSVTDEMVTFVTTQWYEE